MTTWTVTFADESDRAADSRLSARVILFPDGIPRHICLPERQWRVLDWLEAESGYFRAGEIAATAYKLTVASCPESVLRVIQPTGWDQRPSVAFNEAARCAPVDVRLQAFRAAAEDMTGYAQRTFDDTLRSFVAGTARRWMVHHMRLGIGRAANNPHGRLETA